MIRGIENIAGETNDHRSIYGQNAPRSNVINNPVNCHCYYHMCLAFTLLYDTIKLSESFKLKASHLSGPVIPKLCVTGIWSSTLVNFEG